MTSFLLKIIGIITMLFDHIGDSILGHFSFFNLVGRIAFPIFAFQCVQGYMHTKNLKKHFIKLLIFACISQIPFMLFLSTFANTFYLNIFFTFTLGILALYLYDKSKNKIFGFLSVLFISIIGHFIQVDYGAFGILLMFTFYFFCDNKKTNHNFAMQHKKTVMSIIVIFLCFIKYVPDILNAPYLFTTYLSCAIFTCLSLIFILFYNQKEGPKSKYFFYIFYPLHLLILYILSTHSY